MDLLNKFKEFVVKENLIKKGEALLLGISGGPDSLTMLDLFNRIKDDYKLKLVVFHLNHMFREEAASEARFVEEVALRSNLKVIIKKYDVPAFIKKEGVSPEEGARIIRFRLIKEILKELNITKVALGHNKDDLVETIFLHMFRGSGLNGLTGIEPISVVKDMHIIHPILNIYRDDIEKYCQYRNLNPRRDPSNKETFYTRNKIRNDLIPYLENEINPNIKDVMVQMAGIIREEDRYLDQIAEKKLKDLIVNKESDQLIVSQNELKRIEKVIRRRVIRKLFSLLTKENKDLYYNHYKIIDDFILEGKTGKMLDLPGGLKVKNTYGQTVFLRGDFELIIKDYYFTLKVPGEIVVNDEYKLEADYLPASYNWRINVSNPMICYCDADRVETPLVVRNRRPGDKFYPLGMKGQKKLKDFFIDEKIKRAKRDKIPLVVDHSGRIVWVGGMRVDERFKVTEKTKNLLLLKLSKVKGE